jgi:hypothetical protein
LALALAYVFGFRSRTPGPAPFVADPAYKAAVAVIQGVTSDPGTVTAAILGINTAVAHQDLTLI